MPRRAASADHVGQEPEKARALDRGRKFALLDRRHRGDAARHDLAALGNVALQELGVLVVDLGRVGAGERASLAAAKERAASAAATTAGGCRAAHDAVSSTAASSTMPSGA